MTGTPGRRNRYSAHRGFIAPALGTPGARPVILGFILVESLYRLGQQLLGYALELLTPDFAPQVIDGSTPPGLLVNLGSFLILIASLALVLSWVHGRGLRSLLGPRDHLWRDARNSFLAIAVLFLAFETLFNGLSGGPGATLRPLPDWLLLLGPALAALLVQTGSEELFYRGYLQQQIAALMPHPAAWLILPNLAFALAHVSPDVGTSDNTAYVVWAFFFGLVASDLTARAGNLGPALALHLANNAYAFLFFGQMGAPDSGLALVLAPPADPTLADVAASPVLGLPSELALLAVTWGAARLAIRR